MSEYIPEQDESKNRRKIFWWVVFILSVAVVCGTAVFLFLRYNPFAKKANKAAEKYNASMTEFTPDPNDGLSEQPEYLTKAIADNPDVVGWIQIPGSGDSKKYAEINYPILRSAPGVDEDFYLTHDFEKKKSHDAAIYIQQINSPDFSDFNTVIYGHDLRDKTMFTALRQYTDKRYFEKNDTIYLAVPGHIYTYKIYSAFVFDDRHLMYAYDYADSTERERFIETTLKPHSRSYNVRSGVTVTPDDRLITLSTCTPNKNDSERYLVIGVLIHDQPTRESK